MRDELERDETPTRIQRVVQAIRRSASPEPAHSPDDEIEQSFEEGMRSFFPDPAADEAGPSVQPAAEEEAEETTPDPKGKGKEKMTKETVRRRKS